MSIKLNLHVKKIEHAKIEQVNVPMNMVILIVVDTYVYLAI